VSVIDLLEPISSSRPQELGVRRTSEIASHNLYLTAPQKMCHACRSLREAGRPSRGMPRTEPYWQASRPSPSDGPAQSVGSRQSLLRWAVAEPATLSLHTGGQGHGQTDNRSHKFAGFHSVGWRSTCPG
jgi:hypothetical protein